MTAAALPLLAAGTLLATKDAASAATQNNGQNGTTLNVSVSAGLTQDRPTPGTRPKAAEPASLDIWKGRAGKVRYTVNVTEHDGQLGASVSAARSRYRPDGEGVPGAEGNRKPPAAPAPSVSRTGPNA